MRQVPQAPPYYLIIGNGRVARHFQHSFNLLKLPRNDGIIANDSLTGENK